MNESIETISQELGLKLENLIPRLGEPEKFIATCDEFVKSTDDIRPLDFCSFLRKNGFTIEAKVILQFFFINNPGALTRSLAA